jgi:hypothetical protein
MIRQKAKPRRDRKKGTTIRDKAAESGTALPVSFDQALQDWEQEMELVFEENRAAEQLSAEDLAIRINAKA